MNIFLPLCKYLGKGRRLFMLFLCWLQYKLFSLLLPTMLLYQMPFKASSPILGWTVLHCIELFQALQQVFCHGPWVLNTRSINYSLQTFNSTRDSSHLSLRIPWRTRCSHSRIIPSCFLPLHLSSSLLLRLSSDIHFCLFNYIYIFLVLLRYNWHITFCVFQMYSMLIKYIYHHHHHHDAKPSPS